MSELTEDQLKEIATQLSHPEGEKGVEMGNRMNETNIQMTLDTLSALNLQDQEVLLELGHGNCGHLSKIFKTAEVAYYGLDISETMHQEAIKLNESLRKDHQISFSLYNGEKIPFEDNFFDKVMTVNTIYFWNNPSAFLQEIYRVLKSGGKCLITFAQKDFMEKLPFVKHRFELYDHHKMEKLVNTTSFKVLQTQEKSDRTKSKTGEMVDRQYSVVVLEK
ncbi:methyltransferase type 11 [marine bacterium AO1-C]|nr:methyltransferase type 11 [marine bacterium AO1-C]